MIYKDSSGPCHLQCGALNSNSRSFPFGLPGVGCCVCKWPWVISGISGHLNGFLFHILFPSYRKESLWGVGSL